MGKSVVTWSGFYKMSSKELASAFFAHTDQSYLAPKNPIKIN